MPAELLKKLIAIPSVNPMGKDINPVISFESRLTRFLVDYLDKAGIENEVLEVDPGRCNVLAFIPGSTDKTILLDAHQDTVPVDNMTVQPFESLESDGRIYGRGACDVKGSMAVVLEVARELSKTKSSSRPSLLLSFTCDEEHGEKGIFHLVDCLEKKINSSTLLNRLDRRPDLAVVFEPTELNVVSAHRGTVRWKLRTKGVAAHSSEPHKGENAIYRMSKIVGLLEEYAQTELPHSNAHPLLGRPTLSVGRITGGSSVNIVPEDCEIEIDRRLIPGDTAEQSIQAISDYLSARINFGFTMDKPWMIAPPLSDEISGEATTTFLTSVLRFVPQKEIIGVPFGTHAARLAAAEIPSIVFGPGSIEQAHTKDEWIEVDQLSQAKEILIDFLMHSFSMG